MSCQAAGRRAPKSTWIKGKPSTTPTGRGHLAYDDAVSVELGVEPEVGVGDIQVNDYRVWR